VRDYCYVSDLLNAIIIACFTPVEGCQTFNIGSGTGTSVAELARAVMNATGRELPLWEAPRRDRPNGARVLTLVADCRRAKEWLNWSPEVSLRNGIEQTIRSIAAQ
jgi:nucleoside-diphosphate-sugar epimerase